MTKQEYINYLKDSHTEDCDCIFYKSRNFDNHRYEEWHGCGTLHLFIFQYIGKTEEECLQQMRRNGLNMSDFYNYPYCERVLTNPKTGWDKNSGPMIVMFFNDYSYQSEPLRPYCDFVVYSGTYRYHKSENGNPNPNGPIVSDGLWYNGWTIRGSEFGEHQNEIYEHGGSYTKDRPIHSSYGTVLGYSVVVGDAELEQYASEFRKSTTVEEQIDTDETEHARNALAYLFHVSFHNALCKRYHQFGRKAYINVPKIMDNYDETGHLPYIDGKVGIDRWSNEDLENFITLYPGENPDYSQDGYKHSGFLNDIIELYNRIGFAFSKNGTIDTITYKTKDGNITEPAVALLTTTGKVYLQVYVKDLHLTGDEVGKAWRAAYYDYQDYLPRWPMYEHEQECTWYEEDVPIYDNDGNYVSTETRRFCEHLYMSFYDEERRQEMLANMEKYFQDMAKVVLKVTGVMPPAKASGDAIGTFFDKNSSTTPEQKVKIAKCIHDYLAIHNEYDMESEYNQSLYGAMGGWEYEGKGPVCTSYAFAFKYCCNRYGIICQLAFGDASDQHNGEGLHMWNRINYDESSVSDIIWLYWSDDIERLEYFACKEDAEHMDRYRDESWQSYYTDGDPSTRDWENRYGTQHKLPWIQSAQMYRKQSWYEVDVTWDDQGGNNVIWERFNLSTQEMGARVYAENGVTNTGLECYYNYIGQDYYGGQDLSGALEDRKYYGCNVYYW